MKRADTHLSTEALAAYVDGELAAGPASRADEHIGLCSECRLAVAVQRQSKTSLWGSSGCEMPSDLMARLSAIPFVADVDTAGVGDRQLSLGSNGAFQFSVAAPVPRSGSAPREEPRFGASRPVGGRHRAVALSAAVLALGVGVAMGPVVFGVGADTAPPTPAEPLNVSTVGWDNAGR